MVPARVAWAAGNRVGLEFDHMIDEHELLVHIGKPADGRAPDPAYPQGYKRPGLGMSAADRKIAKAWSVAVGLNSARERLRSGVVDSFAGSWSFPSDLERRSSPEN